MVNAFYLYYMLEINNYTNTNKNKIELNKFII